MSNNPPPDGTPAPQNPAGSSAAPTPTPAPTPAPIAARGNQPTRSQRAGAWCRSNLTAVILLSLLIIGTLIYFLDDELVAAKDANAKLEARLAELEKKAAAPSAQPEAGAPVAELPPGGSVPGANAQQPGPRGRPPLAGGPRRPGGPNASPDSKQPGASRKSGLAVGMGFPEGGTNLAFSAWVEPDVDGTGPKNGAPFFDLLEPDQLRQPFQVLVIRTRKPDGSPGGTMNNVADDSPLMKALATQHPQLFQEADPVWVPWSIQTPNGPISVRAAGFKPKQGKRFSDSLLAQLQARKVALGGQ